MSWDFPYYNYADEREKACKAEMKRQQKLYNENRPVYRINGLTEVRFKACMNLLESESHMWFRTAQGVDYKINDKFVGVKMTREEAIKKVEKVVGGSLGKGNIIEALEALGLLKFEEKNIEHLFMFNSQTLGTVKIELWPEGLVLWVGGEIVYKSWKS